MGLLPCKWAYKQKEEKWKFTYVGYQNRVIFLENIQKTFFRPSTLKTENFFNENLMVAYVHIEYSTYQFPEESKGGVKSNGTEKSVVLRGLMKVLDSRNLFEPLY